MKILNRTGPDRICTFYKVIFKLVNCTLYKVIFKIIVARIRPFLPYLISHDQVSFVPGRQISIEIKTIYAFREKISIEAGDFFSSNNKEQGQIFNQMNLSMFLISSRHKITRK